jgi:membrane protease YdiL (CAAX protease family)
MQTPSTTKLNLSLFLLCIPGIISVVLMIPDALKLQSTPPPMPVETIQMVSALQISILLMACIFIGSICARKVWLSAPLIESLINRQDWQSIAKHRLKPAVIIGVIGALILIVFSWLMTPLLPSAFLESAKQLQPSWYVRIFYGGICEEILVRWGLMSMLVWLGYKFYNRDRATPSVGIYMGAIFISAIVFALGHLPMASSLSPVIDAPLITYIMVGNSIAGLIAGYLFCKYGIEAAIFAHITFHLVFMLFNVVST